MRNAIILGVRSRHRRNNVKLAETNRIDTTRPQIENQTPDGRCMAKWETRPDIDVNNNH